jgi:type II restriction enzyme
MEYAREAIQNASAAEMTFCKFLSANDTGKTGGHQSGIYIAKPAVPIIFSEKGIKGENKEKWVKVCWQDGSCTDTRFVYYGTKTRNEYRITNFGRGFPFLNSEYTGALFVLCKFSEFDYKGFFLNSDDEIDQFLDAYGIGPSETNRIIDTSLLVPEIKEKTAIDLFINDLKVEFPSSDEMSAAARMIRYSVIGDQKLIKTNPDKILLEWTDQEYRLFRALEHARYGKLISRGFDSVESFVSTANQVLNRRKSRAGKSLEHHLAAIFDGNEIEYQAQAVTEGNKRPDFLFPSQQAYHDLSFPKDKLVSLAAKTTCKDRWRQVINEADRLRDDFKYLCTLQQGISGAQMDEMQKEKVVLVVPKPYIVSYPKDRQDRIWTLEKFVSYVKEIENG